jgi:hypothetical protein
MATFIKWNNAEYYAGYTPVELLVPLTKQDFQRMIRTLSGSAALVRYPREFIRERDVGRVHIRRWTTHLNEGQEEKWATVERCVAYFSDPDAALLFRIML